MPAGITLYVSVGIAAFLLFVLAVAYCARSASAPLRAAQQDLIECMDEVMRTCRAEIVSNFNARTDESKLTQVRRVKSEKPYVFALGKGYVALISCWAVIVDKVSGDRMEPPGYTVAVRYYGTDDEWEGKGLFFAQEEGKDKIIAELTANLRDAFEV